ncbi:hypothetical protein [Massilia endophytica]|uniref:hypothetical protein n=1 Tax=Massilia endophytica TaxID=2899220 RepID=UPI001E511FC0|nr:hypothetical protein [Massilia endophytica]UGQ46078.1 hypothetical protein LSQ66_20280 [Massilia endophytica]
MSRNRWVITTTYDALDRPLQVKTLDELGAEQTTTHTWEGFKHKIKNPKNFGLSETRDVWGQLELTSGFLIVKGGVNGN